jgi:hypothetical protein
MREQSPVVVSVHVNETRRDNATGGVDSPSCLKRQVPSDGDDAVIADCHIRDKAGRPVPSTTVPLTIIKSLAAVMGAHPLASGS